MNYKLSKELQLKRAFSLIEVLTVIAVIGIITAISMALISGIHGRSEEATAHRHAQLIAAMAGQAMHAGDTQLLAASSKEEAVKILADGVKGSGTFEDVLFQLDLSPKEQLETLPYLTLANGLLVVSTP